ncbi:hypothetical protein GE21DRAFT_7497 [Neurospora crassa]|uniref:Uncharacterized protein n=2 Tax=Neurospora crassa TaxID=5141 RepID=F5HBR1_NEUCR|nr:hypothetical protein NCU01075 [Neurospora crassa OR74A]EAA32451.2 hypothetical protein NCU01075 [Neurospora crassa OR74A]KHE88304.1 hypothetical protein GE21DRAFT_7497 [Neurospora crassa]CAD21316.1 putative protein [Neurospora crassa]|eukprot:XP_961687.2 hypothetical protein NCU01075 [Neurospora crassa OR74A]
MTHLNATFQLTHFKFIALVDFLLWISTSQPPILIQQRDENPVNPSAYLAGLVIHYSEQDQTIVNDFTMSSATGSLLPSQLALIFTHELMNMSACEARDKWYRLAEASGLSKYVARFLAIGLASTGTVGSGPGQWIRALDKIIKPTIWKEGEREKGMNFVIDTVVPSDKPSDGSHFSLLSFAFSHSRELLFYRVLTTQDLTLDMLMISPSTFQLALDDEMQAYAKKGFYVYWNTFVQGPWADDFVRDHIYEKHRVNRYQLPGLPESPYSRSDIQEWLDSKKLLNYYKRAVQQPPNRLSLDSNNSATPKDDLLDMFGSLTLETDSDTGDKGHSMDTS